MAGKITFVGAGPGAPDLITVRGAAALARAQLVIYAGSLVDERILDYAPGARVLNSAGMALEEVLREMIASCERGEQVVRLHTGDPAIYGAVSEQYRELDRRGLDYEVVPGVSSAFAAAAALKVEYTMPELSQSVILTRDAGRTPVPPGEELEKLAAPGGTLCLFLSAGGVPALVEKLLRAGRPPETPAAAVYRASWPNQKIVRTTLGGLAGAMAEAGIKRQAMIVVGRALARDGELSKLYDRNFTHGYRNGGEVPRFTGRCAVFALTAAGAARAGEIASGLTGAEIWVPEKQQEVVASRRRRTFPTGGLAGALRGAWQEYEGLILIMACGIAVRLLAPLLGDKLTDPAVVVVDERGDYAVSLLSGHLGGANRLAGEVARITGGRPVVTTASDVRGLVAFDELAARHGYRVENPEALLELAGVALEGGELELTMPPELFRRYYAEVPNFRLTGWHEDGSIQVRNPRSGTALRLTRCRTVLGIGCRRGVSEATLRRAVDAALAQLQLRSSDLDALATAEPKRSEPGLVALARSLELPLVSFPVAELNQVPVPHPSAAARRHLGLNSACEAAALLGAGPGSRLLLTKQITGPVTTAVAREEA